MHIRSRTRALPLLLLAGAAIAQQPQSALNPTVQRIVDAISEERIANNLRKLESFGTRYVLSAQDDPVHGIGAAKRWIHDELQGYSPRLEVSYQDFTVKKGARQGQIIRDAALSNVVAVLPGTVDKDRFILVTGHYDSVAIERNPYTGQEQIIAEAVRQGVDENEARSYRKILPYEDDLGTMNFEKTAAQPIAPGVTDDGSGTAAVMELARVMSGYQFDKTIVFIAFAAEEVGLSGSQFYSAMAKQKGMQIEAVLNNDIIGSDLSGNGQSATNVLRVFAAGPEDSPSRELGRYMEQIAPRYVPSMKVEVVFRGDRFMRGGDQTPFVNQGYAAVRLTTASEHYKNQHSTTDTFANTSVPYTTRVVRMNAAVLSSLALAPAPPVLNWTWASGPNKGGHVPLLTRGKGGYDAVLHWFPNAEPDLAGYSVMVRSTKSPVWQHETWVGNVGSYTMPDVSIDDIAIGLKAVDKDGNQSIVSPYTEPLLPGMLTAATPTQATPTPGTSHDPPPRPGVSDNSLKRPIESLQTEAIVKTALGSDWVTIDNSVWLSSHGKNTLTRIDPHTNQVVATVTVDKPCSGLTSGFGSIWVPLCGQKAIARVDEKTNKVIATIPTTIADSEGLLTASPTGVWVVTDARSTLLRIDPKTNQPRGSVQVAEGSVAVRYGFGALWVTSPLKNVVTRVDPITRKVAATIPVGKGPRFLTAGEGAVWVVNQGDGTVSRIDPETNTVAATIDCGVTGDGGDVSAGGGFVWVTVFSIPVTRIDVKTNTVTRQWVGAGGDSIGFGHGSVWLANLSAGTVWRFKP